VILLGPCPSVDFSPLRPYFARSYAKWTDAMKVLRSLKSAKTRDRDNRVVRRKGRIYVINKRKPRFKARQG